MIISSCAPCRKLHHAAFERYLLGVTPDPEVTVCLDVLEDSTAAVSSRGR
jgi:hypothetical protein